MGHYAKVIDGVVTQVIVADATYFDTFIDTEPAQWIKTSYNTNGGIHYIPNTNEPSPDQSKALRKNFAGIGFTYDSVRDAFIPPNPFPSWTLDEFSCTWVAPKPYPQDGKSYKWDETTLEWVLI